MQSVNDDEKREVLGEVLADELKAIHELVSDVPTIKKTVEALDNDMQIVKSDTKAIKAVVKNHEARLVHLELI
jgi:outer membrane murein-binding lipoprotein Lpp